MRLKLFALVAAIIAILAVYAALLIRAKYYESMDAYALIYCESQSYAFLKANQAPLCRLMDDVSRSLDEMTYTFRVNQNHTTTFTVTLNKGVYEVRDASVAPAD
ncbi:hypothetical protein [Roseibium sp. RKSG952]|uniref:hypothetical protein n=1 Tax=Roseibium sp. RKSG952 TaxID=2529384 RepID=UPI0012BB4A19|nr:hypothetical protein [Roseibium sp. RKSG952]MTH97917.1 hypothetical protein [Roseibium sp. RKSG952]